MGRERTTAVLVLWAFLWVACSDPPNTADVQAKRTDARALLNPLAHDPAMGPLDEADHMVRARRPVRAAEIVRDAVIPAVLRQRETIAAVRCATSEGARAQARLVGALQARSASLAGYADVLERGEVEDARLASALHAQAMAERALADVQREVEALARGGP